MPLNIYTGYSIFRYMNIDPKEFFSALANDTRLRCLMLLMQHDELCVCELTYAIDAAQPHISRHLAQLRGLGLVSDRREGLWIHYRIHPQLPEWLFAVLRATAEGVERQSPFATDERTLSAMPNRPGAPRCA
jgi:ArsR family transcriptional regulator